MASIFDRVYAESPVWLQNLGISVYGLVWKRRRFGGRFRALVEEFASRDRYTTEQWREYQTRELRRLLLRAVGATPFYREKLGARLGGPGEIEHFEIRDIHELPILSKDEVRRESARLVAEDVAQREVHTYLTSGTTGTPLAIKFTNDVHRQVSAAYEARVRRWAGVDHKMSRAMIGGRLVVPKAESSPPFWRYNLAERQLYLSAFHISAANARAYAEALNQYRPDYLVGYAVSHYFLAALINEQGLEVHRPRAILTSSESLTPDMREALQRAYGCPVFDAYSGVEACCLASECEQHQMHVSPDVGLIEVVDDAGKPVPLGQPGEIVATGFLNHTQPLLRYRTGDYAVFSDTPCSCGRAMPVLSEIMGRLEDTIFTADGRMIVRFHGIFLGLPNIREGQVIQETISDIRLKLVVESGFGEEDRQVLAQRFEERLGRVNLSIEIVEAIERTERGKYRAVISKVSRPPTPV